MDNNSKVIALLIDAENVSPKYIKLILDEVSLHGTPAYKRIYGDWTNPDMASWKKVLLEHNITPIQQFRYTQGKNASDSSMIIDAMDILYAKNVDGFCLVSSDSDFTRLAARLRESRMFVIGMGESKTPTAFKSACDTFKYLDVLMGMKEACEQLNVPCPQEKPCAKSAGKTKPKKPDTPQPAPRQEEAFVPLKEIVAKVHELIEHDADDDGFMPLSQIGTMLNRMYADFDSRNYGFSQLNKLIGSVDRFEMKCESFGNGGKNLMVRNR